MFTESRKGFYLLVVAFVMVFFLPGRIAKADGISDTDHDELKWSDSGDKGDHLSDTKHDESIWLDWGEDHKWTSDGDSDNSDSDGPIVGNGNEGGDGEHDVENVDPVAGDPAGNAVPEPSSLALLTIGIFGVMSLARRQANSGVRHLA